MNFKFVDSVIYDKHVKSFIEDEYKPTKVQSQLTNMIVYDLEFLNTDRAVPYAFRLYKLSKISGKHHRDITQREHGKCRNDCIVLKGTDCNKNMSDHRLEFEGDAKRVDNKNVNYTFYLLALEGSGFNRYVVWNNLPHWRTIVSLNKNGSGIVSSKIFNGYVDQDKKLPP